MFDIKVVSMRDKVNYSIIVILEKKDCLHISYIRVHLKNLSGFKGKNSIRIIIQQLFFS
jgi:hypothetical protein